MKELSLKLILNQLFTFINVYVGKVQQDNLQMCPLYKVELLLLLKLQYCEICLIFVLPLCASLMHVKYLFPFWQKTFFCMKMYSFAMV